MSEGGDPKPCLECGEMMVRLYNFGAVTFNGSGFYKTDK
jgi:predicted nucleic acid-binding Zn ribbon protein